MLAQHWIPNEKKTLAWLVFFPMKKRCCPDVKFLMKKTHLLDVSFLSFESWWKNMLAWRRFSDVGFPTKKTCIPIITFLMSDFGWKKLFSEVRFTMKITCWADVRFPTFDLQWKKHVAPMPVFWRLISNEKNTLPNIGFPLLDF